MFDDTNEAPVDDTASDLEKDGEAQGDGMHHHTINEDEGGGYHSVHTHPDGREEHEDHVSYDDAKDWADEKFGHGDRGEDEGGEGEGAMDEDSAGSYGRVCG